jgi:23S rRNA (guanosine2251-2'-O)-methyltransferase
MNRKLKLWELNRIDEEGFKNQKKFPITVVLDDIRSFNNVGSFFRTCDAFNIEKIYLCGITPKPPHRDIQKTALGATETVEWEYHESIEELVIQLKTQGKCICSIEQSEDTLFLNNTDEIQDREVVLVFGNEVNGVSQKIIDTSDYVIEIPQYGTKHSLNVSVCAGVVLWEFIRTKKMA